MFNYIFEKLIRPAYWFIKFNDFPSILCPYLSSFRHYYIVKTHALSFGFMLKAPMARLFKI